MNRKPQFTLTKEIIASVVLTLSAIGLGVVLYKQHFSGQTKLTSYPTPQPTLPQSIKPSSITNNSAFNLGTVKFPSESSTEAEKKAFSAMIASVAKPANGIVITNCQATSEVTQLNLGQKFTIKNQDPKDHLINITPENQLKIKANSTLEVTATFKHGIGVYGFACDQNQGLSGILSII